MNCFAICWKNKQISLEELKLVWHTNIRFYNASFFTFDMEEKNEKLLYQLWWLIKWGRIVEYWDLKDLLQDVKIIWSNDKWLWDQLKSDKIVRRYKNVSMQHTDLEIKKKWKELIRIWSVIWLVLWYQNISLYEDIDFGKPARSMNMWMMPAKLAHILINIALNKIENWNIEILSFVHQDKKYDGQKSNNTNMFTSFHFSSFPYCIYDPFVWSWTTGFLANYMWFDFLWSDKNIEYVKKNYNWWKTTKRHQNNNFFEIFQQDIFKPLDVREKYLESMLIVTEWRLWPIVTQKTDWNQIKLFQQEVLKLYQAFLNNISNLFKTNNIKLPTMVFTIPYYINQNNFIESDLKSLSTKLWRKFNSVEEIYAREWQFVGRKIIILNSCNS